MTTNAIATAADYADAMITARRAKNVLWSITLLMLLVELALFFVARYKVDLATDSAATDRLKYVIGGIGFLGVVFPIVLSVILLLIAGIMLVGRLIGVSKLVSAFIWSVILTALLFPWQAFLINQSFTSPDFKIPGVLYTWWELVQKARINPVGWEQDVLYWGRFVGWPVVALIVLMLIGVTSRKGLRLALGEIPPDPIVIADELSANGTTRV
jgi:hypothetical protein